MGTPFPHTQSAGGQLGGFALQLALHHASVIVGFLMLWQLFLAVAMVDRHIEMEHMFIMLIYHSVFIVNWRLNITHG